ncbi:hypothetical protein BJX65DRAFT_238236 [Aspergillus insuetus]
MIRGPLRWTFGSQKLASRRLPFQYLRENSSLGDRAYSRTVQLPRPNWAKDKPSPTFGKLWLRDNCQCPKCIHPDTRQRMVQSFSVYSLLDTALSLVRR